MIELGRILGLGLELTKRADVPNGRVDIVDALDGTGPLVACNDCRRFERSDLLEGCDPGVSGLFVWALD